MTAIDVNSDLGEGLGLWKMGDDRALLEIVSSANVACGFHAGDPSTMRSVCEVAAEQGVAIGAHVAYPDLAGFGRRFIDIDASEAARCRDLSDRRTRRVRRAAGSSVSYVKPHGASTTPSFITRSRQPRWWRASPRTHRSRCSVCPTRSHSIMPPPLGFVRSAARSSIVPTQPMAHWLRVACRVPCCTMSKRSRPAPCAWSARAGATTIDGAEIELVADSICVHGDTPGAVAIATAVRNALEGGGSRSVRSPHDEPVLPCGPPRW